MDWSRRHQAHGSGKIGRRAAPARLGAGRREAGASAAVRLRASCVAARPGSSPLDRLLAPARCGGLGGVICTCVIYHRDSYHPRRETESWSIKGAAILLGKVNTRQLQRGACIHIVRCALLCLKVAPLPPWHSTPSLNTAACMVCASVWTNLCL